MPSPPIPRAVSAPDITSPISPNKSVRTTRSTGSPIISWPKKVGHYVTVTKQKTGLREEDLREFNRRNALEKNSMSSPYYKGLIDYTLGINREKLTGTSPGRESQAPSVMMSTASRTSFVVKVQEWGTSCFTSSKRTEKSSSSSGSTWTKSSNETRSSMKLVDSGLTVTTSVQTTKTKNEMGSAEKKKVSFPEMKDDTITTSDNEKPLRERDSEIPAMSPGMLPVTPPAADPPESFPYPLPDIPSPQRPIETSETQISTNLPQPQEPPSEMQAPAASESRSAEVMYENTDTNTIETEIEYKWADTYRPSCLQEFICNKGEAVSLLNLVKKWDHKLENCGHFIFEGNPGVGKRTMIWALLREAFGQDKVQAREECKKFYLKGEEVSSIFVNLMVSQHHIEVNLSELGGYEKHVIVELIKENNEILTNTYSTNRHNCKAIILYEADRLSTDALSYIKWMLEKFKGKNKIFFCCSDASKLHAIKSICTFVQLLEPSTDEILDVLTFIAQKEGIQLPQQLAHKFADNAKHNLRQAIRSFEATWHFSGCCASLKEDQEIKTGWEDKIAKIAKNVIEEQSPKQLYHIRGELQNLIEHNVAPEFIFHSLKDELKKILPRHYQPQFDSLYEEYQKNHAIKKYLVSAHQLEELGKRQNDQRNNVHQFMRIEEFIARFMSWYKCLVKESDAVR